MLTITPAWLLAVIMLSASSGQPCLTQFNDHFQTARLSEYVLWIEGNRTSLSDVYFPVSTNTSFDSPPDHHLHERYTLKSINDGIATLDYTVRFDARSFGGEVSECAGTLSLRPAAVPDVESYPKILTSIANEVEKLGAVYPQLRDFKDHAVLNNETQSLTYSFNTTHPNTQGGWTSGVPHPKADGVWFYLSLRPVDSERQIDTQPANIHPLRLGAMAVTVLLQEGSKTDSFEYALWRILRAHGVHETSD